MPNPSSPSASPRHFERGRRMDVIKGLGLEPDVEANLLGLANDPTVVELFRTVMPDKAGDAQYLRIALKSVLKYLHTSLDDSCVEQSKLVAEVVEKEKKRLQEEHAGIVSREIEKAMAETTRTYERKLTKMQKRHNEETTRNVNQLKAVKLSSDRSLCTNLVDFENDLTKHIGQLLSTVATDYETAFSVKLSKTANENPLAPPERISRSFELVSNPSSDTSDSDDSTDENKDAWIHLELASPQPYPLSCLHDAGTAIRYCLSDFPRVLSSMWDQIQNQHASQQDDQRKAFNDKLASAIEAATRRPPESTQGSNTSLKMNEISQLYDEVASLKKQVKNLNKKLVMQESMFKIAQEKLKKAASESDAKVGVCLLIISNTVERLKRLEPPVGKEVGLYLNKIGQAMVQDSRPYGKLPQHRVVATELQGLTFEKEKEIVYKEVIREVPARETEQKKSRSLQEKRPLVNPKRPVHRPASCSGLVVTSCTEPSVPFYDDTLVKPISSPAGTFLYNIKSSQKISSEPVAPPCLSTDRALLVKHLHLAPKFKRIPPPCDIGLPFRERQQILSSVVRLMG